MKKSVFEVIFVVFFILPNYIAASQLADTSNKDKQIISLKPDLRSPYHEGKWEGYYLDKKMGCIPITMTMDSCWSKDCHGTITFEMPNAPLDQRGKLGNRFTQQKTANIHLIRYSQWRTGLRWWYQLIGEVRMDRYRFLLDIEYFAVKDHSTDKLVTGLKGTLRESLYEIFTEGPIVLWKVDK